MIILLDGSKGAGKTTTGELLLKYIENSVYLGIDVERRDIPMEDGNRSKRNEEAFDKIIEKANKYLDEGKNLIIDCGLVEDKFLRINALGVSRNIPVYKFLLKASYQTQLDRVLSRDTTKDAQLEEKRFKEIHTPIHSKSFENFTTIETDKLNPIEVIDLILKTLKH
jgi:cytidylate kinase